MKRVIAFLCLFVSLTSFAEISPERRAQRQEEARKSFERSLTRARLLESAAPILQALDAQSETTIHAQLLELLKDATVPMPIRKAAVESLYYHELDSLVYVDRLLTELPFLEAELQSEFVPVLVSFIAEGHSPFSAHSMPRADYLERLNLAISHFDRVSSPLLAKIYLQAFANRNVPAYYIFPVLKAYLRHDDVELRRIAAGGLQRPHYSMPEAEMLELIETELSMQTDREVRLLLLDKTREFRSEAPLEFLALLSVLDTDPEVRSLAYDISLELRTRQSFFPRTGLWWQRTKIKCIDALLL